MEEDYDLEYLSISNSTRASKEPGSYLALPERIAFSNQSEDYTSFDKAQGFKRSCRCDILGDNSQCEHLRMLGFGRFYHTRVLTLVVIFFIRNS